MMNFNRNLNPNLNPFQQQRQNGVDPQQFKQWLPQINNNMMQQLAAQARQQGISEQDITTGLNFINSLRSGG